MTLTERFRNTNSILYFVYGTPVVLLGGLLAICATPQIPIKTGSEVRTVASEAMARGLTVKDCPRQPPGKDCIIVTGPR